MRRTETIRRGTAFVVLALAIAPWPRPAGAQACSSDEPVRLPSACDVDIATTWHALPPERLDALRGGFELPSGLQVSFGIARTVFINGSLVTSTSIDIPNVAQMTQDQARALANAIAPMLVRDGIVGPGSADIGLTIQNSLDNQSIRSQTTLDVGTTGLDAYKTFNVQSTLQDAVIGFSLGH